MFFDKLKMSLGSVLIFKN